MICHNVDYNIYRTGCDKVNNFVYMHYMGKMCIVCYQFIYTYVYVYYKYAIYNIDLL